MYVNLFSSSSFQLLTCTQENRLDTKNRPNEVAAWLKCGRKLDTIPKISDVSVFANQWRQWWIVLQPPERVPATPERWPLLRPTDNNLDWQRTLRGGRNGLFIVILTLVWWSAAVSTTTERHEFESALEDVDWVFEEMAPKRAKRHIDTTYEFGGVGVGFVKR